MTLPSPDRFKSFRYIRNTQSAKGAGHHFGSRFQQDIEPAGRYCLEDPGGALVTGWERGSVTLKNPLVIAWNTNPDGGYDSTSWKAVLNRQYKAKGLALSRKLVKAGYDAIITVREIRGVVETSECVLLTEIR